MAAKKHSIRVVADMTDRAVVFVSRIAQSLRQGPRIGGTFESRPATAQRTLSADRRRGAWQSMDHGRTREDAVFGGGNDETARTSHWMRTTAAPSLA